MRVERTYDIEEAPDCECDSLSKGDMVCVALGGKPVIIALISQILYFHAPLCDTPTGKDYSAAYVSAAIGLSVFSINIITILYFGLNSLNGDKMKKSKYKWLYISNGLLTTIGGLWNIMILITSGQKC